MVRLGCWLALVLTEKLHLFKNTGYRSGVAQLEWGKGKLKVC